MLIRVVGNEITHPLVQYVPASIPQLRFERAFQHEYHMALCAPMISKVTGRVLHYPDPHVSSFNRPPECLPCGSSVFLRNRVCQVEDLKRDVSDFHDFSYVRAQFSYPVFYVLLVSHAGRHNHRSALSCGACSHSHTVLKRNNREIECKHDLSHRPISEMLNEKFQDNLTEELVTKVDNGIFIYYISNSLALGGLAIDRYTSVFTTAEAGKRIHAITKPPAQKAMEF